MLNGLDSPQNRMDNIPPNFTAPKGQLLKKPIQFGKYYLLDRVNVGGMAEVFKAKAFGVEGFERLVAVKRILPAIAEDVEFISMFIDEAKIAVQLSHANICQIFDLGKVEDSYFIALEYVFGKDLRAIFDRCKQRPVDGSLSMPIAQACFVVMKACEGLDYAHNKRDASGEELHLVHRDVSPQNILISYDGEVKLIDFGIAKAVGKASNTQQGILKGKFGYMSPEQVRGLALDRRCDVFSLGIVLYEMLTGERLFVGDSDFSTLEKVRNVEILPPSTYNRRISDELERIVLKALAKDVEDRYQNAIDLHDDLQAYMYTAGEFYSRKDLATWMRRVFGEEIRAEEGKNEQYRQMALPPPKVASTDARARRPSSPPPPVPVQAGGQADPDMGWDEDELATNIYDGGGTDPGIAVEVIEAQAAGHTDEEPLAEILGQNGTNEAISAAFGEAQPASDTTDPRLSQFDFVQEAPKPFISSTMLTPQEPARSGPPVGLMVFAGAMVIALGMAIVYVMQPKMGRLNLLTEPVEGLQITLDDQPQKLTSTPATLTLKSGKHNISIKHDGYLPHSQSVEVTSGGEVELRAVLEPLGTTGFTLVSEPAGAQAFLDGKALGVTPLKVQSLVPGKHHIEVKDATGVWTQDVDIHSGNMLDLSAKLAPADAPKAEVKAEAPAQVAPKAEAPKVEAPKAEAPKAAVEPTKPAVVAKAEPVAKTEPKAEPIAKSEPKHRSRAAAAEVAAPTASAKEEETAEPAEKPAKAVAKPEKQAAGAEGYLRIGSKPWTNITVDGKDTGLHTPQTKLKLAAGVHKITLANPQFNIKETFSVTIGAGETETVIKDLRPAGSEDAE